MTIASVSPQDFAELTAGFLYGQLRNHDKLGPVIKTMTDDEKQALVDLISGVVLHQLGAYADEVINVETK